MLFSLRQEKKQLKIFLGELSSRPGEEAELQSDLVRQDLRFVNKEILLLPVQRLGEMLGIRKSN